MTCSFTGNLRSGASDKFIFNNLSAAKILPGSVCSVSGCYWLTGTTYVKTPKMNCTIPGEASALICIKIKTKILHHSNVMYLHKNFCAAAIIRGREREERVRRGKEGRERKGVEEKREKEGN